MIVASKTLTGSDNRTKYISPATFRGQQIYLGGEWESQYCEHEVHVVHHYGEGGVHYCPTGFVWCPHCMAVGDEPDPPSCIRWGK